MNQLTTERVGTILEPHAALHGSQSVDARHYASLGAAKNSFMQLPEIRARQDCSDQSCFLPQNPPPKRDVVYGQDVAAGDPLLNLQDKEQMLKLDGGMCPQPSFDFGFPSQFRDQPKQDALQYRQGAVAPMNTQLAPQDNPEIQPQPATFLDDTAVNAGAMMKYNPGVMQPGLQNAPRQDSEMRYKGLRQQQIFRSIPDVSNISDPEFAANLVYSQFLFPYEKHQIRALDSMISGQKDDFSAIPTQNKQQSIHVTQEDGAGAPQLQKESFLADEPQRSTAHRDGDNNLSQVYYGAPASYQQHQASAPAARFQYYPQNPQYQQQQQSYQKLNVDDNLYPRSRNSCFTNLAAPSQHAHRKYSLQANYHGDSTSLFYPPEYPGARVSSPSKVLDKNVAGHEIDALRSSWQNPSPTQAPSAHAADSRPLMGHSVHARTPRSKSTFQPAAATAMGALPVRPQFYGSEVQQFPHVSGAYRDQQQLQPTVKRGITPREIRRSSVNIPMNQTFSSGLQAFHPSDYASNQRYSFLAPKGGAYASSRHYRSVPPGAAVSQPAAAGHCIDPTFGSVGSDMYQGNRVHILGYPKPITTAAPIDILEDKGVSANSAESSRDTGSDTDQDSIDFNDVTVVALKQHLRRRGLPSFGKKSQLVERLKSDLEIVRKQQQVGRNSPGPASNIAGAPLISSQKQDLHPAPELDSNPAGEGGNPTARDPPSPQSDHPTPLVAHQQPTAPQARSLDLFDSGTLAQQQKMNFSLPVEGQFVRNEPGDLQICNSTAVSSPALAPSLVDAGMGKEFNYAAEVQALLNQSSKQPFDLSGFVHRDITDDCFTLQSCDPAGVFKTA